MINNCANCNLKEPTINGWRCSILQMAVFPEVQNMGRFCQYHPARKGKGNKIVHEIVSHYYQNGGGRKR